VTGTNTSRFQSDQKEQSLVNEQIERWLRSLGDAMLKCKNRLLNVQEDKALKNVYVTNEEGHMSVRENSSMLAGVAANDDLLCD
jgi:hypothetical protein